MNSTLLPALKKPSFGQACNGCGYCCSEEPCRLAQEFLHCTKGPCIALEQVDGKYSCGLVRNPLGYLYKAANPASDFSPLSEAPLSEEGHQLSIEIATALGLGQGCDSADDEESAQWPLIARA